MNAERPSLGCALLREYLPLSRPLFSGDQGVTPSPSSLAMGMSSCSTVRSSSEYSICSPMNADQPRNRAVTFASATSATHACAREVTISAATRLRQTLPPGFRPKFTGVTWGKKHGPTPRRAPG